MSRRAGSGRAGAGAGTPNGRAGHWGRPAVGQVEQAETGFRPDRLPT
ncbi:hypothetical protein ACIRA2_05060 [Streptomyces griseoviridis]